MSYFDKDALSMLDVYLLESRQLMQKLDEILLETEKEDSLPMEEIHNIFRIMHTVKSSSAMMGLSGLSETAHSVEDLFSLLRDDCSLLEGKKSEIFELLFCVSDFMQKELDRMEREDYIPAPADAVKSEIEACLAGLKKKPDQAAEKPPSSVAQAGRAAVRVVFEPECKMENIRAFMLLRQVREQFPGVQSIPANPEKDAKSAEVIKKDGLLILLDKDQIKPVLEIVKTGLFVQRCELVDLPLAGAVEPVSGPGTKADTGSGAEEGNNREEPEKNNAEAAVKPENSYLNVRMERLDTLQNLTGELIILMSAFRNDLREEPYRMLEEKFGHSIVHLLDELESTVMNMRMIPVSQIIPKLKRVARDISRKQGKDVEFTVSGQDVEADKNIVEHLYEASMHVIRNSVDHGIESPIERRTAGKPERGRITFDVESSGGEMTVRISDDGKGMDEETLRKKAREKHLLTKPEEEYTPEEIFELSTLPGLSTKQKTNEYSGRGVGMDIVRRIAENCGGHLRITSQQGRGTTITINLPLTNTIVNMILFSSGGSRFGILSHQVKKFAEYRPDHPDIREERGMRVLMTDDRVIPIIDVAEVYGLAGGGDGHGMLIHAQTASKEACLLVDQVYGEERIVLKSLPPLFGAGYKRETGMNGCSVLGDGNICMSVDVETLLAFAQKNGVKGGVQNGC